MVKFSHDKSMKGEQKYSCTLSLTQALVGGGCLTPRPGRFTPGKQTRYPLYRRLGGPKGRSGRVRKISPHRESIPGTSPQQADIPTEISRSIEGSRHNCNKNCNHHHHHHHCHAFNLFPLIFATNTKCIASCHYDWLITKTNVYS